MTKKISFPFLAILFLFISCKKDYTKLVGETQGTLYHITYYEAGGKNLHSEIDSILHDFDMSLSSYIPNSLISRINKNEDNVKTDNYFNKVFIISKEVYKNTDGMFDITVAPLVKAWGFGKDSSVNHDKRTIDSLLQFIGSDKVRLTENTIIKNDSRIQLDVNAVAQGYSVDVISEYLEIIGIENYLVEIGGEIRAKGVNPKGEDWKVGIDMPYDNNFKPGEDLQAILRLKNKSLATSGNYRKIKTDEKGNKYSHSINPKTGYPQKQNILSATIIADDCIIADAYATACMVSGLEKSKKLIKQHHELDAYFIYSDNSGNMKVWMTPSIKKMIVKEN